MVVRLYRAASTQENAPAFSGGVLDAWPAWAVSSFAVLKQEEAAVLAWRKSEASRG